MAESKQGRDRKCGAWKASSKGLLENYVDQRPEEVITAATLVEQALWALGAVSAKTLGPKRAQPPSSSKANRKSSRRPLRAG